MEDLAIMPTEDLYATTGTSLSDARHVFSAAFGTILNLAS